ncbi:hypothetical protein [Streptomyces sp. NPDC058583]|uniref:hypothetical protein n=1 Tax=unclassified Streptomyces TaxID=2593676 RepID=UPI0036664DC1
MTEAVREVPALGAVEHPVEVVHRALLRLLALFLQVDLTGVSGGSDGLPVGGGPKSLRVLRDSPDWPARLTGDVAADAVSVELTELLLVLGGEGSGHGLAHPLTRAW